MALTLMFGCEEPAKRQARDGNGLSQAAYESLKLINEIQEEQVTAVRLAFGESLEPQRENKSQKLAELLKGGGCRRQGARPPDRYDRSWGAQHRVDGTACPIHWNQSWSFNKDSRTWSFNESFRAMDPDRSYRKVNPLGIRTWTGQVVTSGMVGNEKVRGLFHTQQFFVEDLGALNFEIRVTQDQSGSQTAGTVAVRIWGSGWKHSGVLRWHSSRSTPEYSANGTSVSQKAFRDMFSSYGLEELMDLAQKIQ